MSERRRAIAARLQAAAQAVPVKNEGPYDWLTKCPAEELAAWAADNAPMTWSQYKELPIGVRLRLVALDVEGQPLVSLARRTGRT